MFVLNGFDITLTRGDTASIEFTFSGDIPTDDDRVVASLKCTQTQTNEIWRKTLERTASGTYILEIHSADTANLDFGQYWWDVRVFYGDRSVVTPIPPSSFTIARVVTNLPDTGGG